MKNKNIHVLYVLTKLELGGAQKVCLTLLKGINKNNISTGLLSGTEGVLVDEAKKHPNIHLLKSFKREVGIKTILQEFKAFFQMISQMRKLKKQYPKLIVHTHSTKAGLMGRWAAFFAGIKNRIHTVHGFGFHEHQSLIAWHVNFIFEYLTSFITTHYVCVSMADRKIGKHYFPQFWEKSSIIRAAVDWNNFYKPAIRNDSSKDQFIFGTVSCLKPQKNILDLLKAFQKMLSNLPKEKQQKTILQIIGDGTQRPMIEKWIANNNLLFNVTLLGWQHDVASWMQTWDTFVMSSLWEGLPCAIIEARLSKLPVISYKIAGIPEIIKNNKNGFLITPGNWKELAQKMTLLVKNNELQGNLKNHNDNLVDFKNETMIKKHKTLYQKITNHL